MSAISRIEAAVDLATIRAYSRAGTTLSAEMTLLLCLVIFDGYELFPAHAIMPNRNLSLNPDIVTLKHAESAGTLNKENRAPQYQGINPKTGQPFASAPELLKAVNAQGDHIRGVQTNVGQIQHQLYNLKLRNAVVVAVITGVLARAPEIWAFFYSLLH